MQDKASDSFRQPFVRKDIIEILSELRTIRGISRIGMTTNGINTRSLLEAIDRNLIDAANISLDSLHRERYEHMTRR